MKLLEQYLISAYLASLRNDSQMHVRMCQPQTVGQCFVLGRLYEMTHPLKQSTGSANKSPFVKNSGGYKKEGESKNGSPISNEPQKNPLIQPKKFLSSAEMRDRR